MVTQLNERPHFPVILHKREFMYRCKKGEGAIAGRHIVKGCPGIIVWINSQEKWQGATSVLRGEYNLHVERCNQEQTTLDSAN